VHLRKTQKADKQESVGRRNTLGKVGRDCSATFVRIFQINIDVFLKAMASFTLSF
jgi:hypothetical protein